MIEAITEFVTQHAGSPWALPVVLALCAVDGFFPAVPSESVVVGLSAIAVSVGRPDLWALFGVAAAGAMIGDNIAYAIGRHGGLARLRRQDKPKIKRAMDWADGELSRRGAMIILVGRYIPLGRVAVNVTAGATHFRWVKFVAIDLVAALSWAGYSVGIGALAGRWMKENPLMGAAIAIALAVVVGWGIDRVIQRVSAGLGPKPHRPVPFHLGERHDPVTGAPGVSGDPAERERRQ